MDLILIIILCLIVELILAIFIAKEFENIAEMKGHYGRKYFWWSFLLGLVGWLMVIALPDKTIATKQSFDELPEI